MRAAPLGILAFACQAAPAPCLVQQERWSNDPDLNPVIEIAMEAKEYLQQSDGSRLALGSHCSMVPVGPPGWYAVQDLVATRRSDYLIELANSAPTKEGQLWAVYGLVRLKQLEPEELVTRASGIAAPLWTCDGCSFWQTAPLEAVEALPAVR